MSDKLKPTHWDSLKLAIQEAVGQKPTRVEGQMAERTEYYKWVLLNKLKGQFEIKCPETWDKDYLLDVLLLEGKIGITDSPIGVTALRCAPTGLNAYERATDLTFANPVLPTFTRKIDVNAVLLFLFDDKYYMSFLPTIMIYAQKLASCDSAIDVNLMNTKVSFIFDCADKKQADEMKLLYDKVSSGEPAVFYHSSNGMDLKDRMQFFSKDVRNTYICELVQAEKRAIYNEFLTQIGINNAAQEKKERLLVDEVNSNNDELRINMHYCYENIKKCVDKANKMFEGLNLSIKLPFIDALDEAAEARKEKNNEPNGFNGNMGDKEQQDKSDRNAEDR